MIRRRRPAIAIDRYARISPICKNNHRGRRVDKAYARRYPRLGVNLTVEYAVDDQPFRGAAKTLSGGGLFLSQIDGLEPGKEVSVRFRPARHLPVIAATARVLYVLP